jgi:thiopeptide-type bacteriocin biosynthesis protein
VAVREDLLRRDDCGSILREAIAPAANEAIAGGAADKWFFIRYSDPAWHVRARFHGQPERLRQEVWPTLQSALAPMLEDGRVWRLQLDTYKREVERYGGAKGSALSECVFHADSEAAAEIVGLMESYLHMSANRLLRSTHPAQEMALYDLLTRLYSAQFARGQMARAA